MLIAVRSMTQIIFRVDSHRRAAAEKARLEEANIHSDIFKNILLRKSNIYSDIQKYPQEAEGVLLLHIDIEEPRTKVLW